MIIVNWRTIIRNVFSNWASYLVTALIGFFLAPMVVHSLGNTGYGLWTLILSLTGYFGLLDLGLRSSVGRFVTRYMALHDEEGVNRTINTALLMLSFGGILAFATTVVTIQFFLGSLHVDPQYAAAAKIAFLITGLNTSCILPLSVFSSVLIALERFDALSGVTIIGELTRAVLVVTFLKLGYGLVSLALISLAVTTVEYCALGVCAKQFYPPMRISLRFWDRTTLKDLFTFGIFRFIWIVANQLIFYSDSVVIGIFLSAGAITFYAIAGSLINYGRNIVSLVTDTLYPAVTRMDARQDTVGLQNMLLLGTRIALLVAVPLCLGFVFLGRQFITLWMGSAYASSATLLLILTIPQLGSMSQYASALTLGGMAKHRVLAYLVMGEGVANLILSIVLVRKIGLAGVAWGTVVPHLLCTTVLVPLYTLRILKLDVRQYIRKAFVRPLVAGIPSAAIAYALSVSVDTASWLVFAAEAAAITGSYLLASYFLCLDSAQRTAVLEKVWALCHREAAANEA